MTIPRALSLILTAGVILAVQAAMAAKPKRQTVEVRLGTIGLTKAYVSENHIRQRMDLEISRRTKAAEMGEAAIYRSLMDGKIDLGSVLALPKDVGIKDFEGAFSTAPDVRTLGHLAVSACLSAKRPLSQLTVQQVGRIISGEITEWRQLGAGVGKIDLVSDQRSIDLIVALTGVKPAANTRKIDNGMAAVLTVCETGHDGLVLTSSKLHQQDFSKMPRFALVPVANVAGDKPVLPSVASIRDGSYPLARPWRIILRPNASETATKVLNRLANVAEGKDFDHRLQLWMVSPGEAPLANHIRIASMGWQGELVAAAKAYQQGHPEVTITFSNDYLNVPARLLRKEIDMGNYTGELRGHIGGRDSEKFAKEARGACIERTIGYWPFAVAVHPGNPMKSITAKQLRRLMSDPDARWGDIGRPTDGRIRLHVYSADRVARALGSGDGSDSPGEPLSIRGARKHKMGVRLPDREIPDLADDPDAIALWYHNKKLAASGYKILPIVAGAGKRPLAPTDTAAVASGAYPLRTPLRVLIRASSPPHVKAFMEWLSTPEAALGFKRGEGSRYRYCWPVAHISEAPGGPASTAITQHTVKKPVGEEFDGPIAGAVAILPAEPLSMLFRMADRSHHTAYERAIGEAIEADGRLKVVDRTHLSRVLNEHRLKLLGLDDAPREAIVSADVVVVSYIVTEKLKTFLLIRAVHGPTGRLLGELKLPIDPAHPASFDPPLEQVVRRWWHTALRRLHDSREKPSWILLDVYASSLAQLDAADALRETLQASLETDRSIFASDSSTLDQTQQETLLRSLGLASPSGGRFVPPADFTVDARLLSPEKLHLRLRDAAMKVLAEETLSGDAQGLKSAAKAWLKRRIVENPRRLVASPPATVIDDWAAQQAKVELATSRQLTKRMLGIYRSPFKSESDKAKAQARWTAARAHVRRAAQLDPTNEDAAYEALPVHQDLVGLSGVGLDNTRSHSMILSPLERFLDSFPKSKHHPEVLRRHAIACAWLATKAKFPRGTEGRTVRLACYRKALADYTRYVTHYKRSDVEYGPLTFSGYLHYLQRYLDFAQPPAEALEALVADWSRQFDTREKKACHSDFVRLVVLKHKKDQAGFIERLTKMQQRWPDPKHPQWTETKGPVDLMIYGLFHIDSSKSSFQLWHRGLRGIGEIPTVGYKVEEKTPQIRGMLSFTIPKESKGVDKAIRFAARAYKKIHPQVECRYFVETTLRRSIEHHRWGIIVVVGQLSADDRKAVQEIQRTKDIPLHRIGYVRGAPGLALQEVSLLRPPGTYKTLLLDDFLRFLATPEGRGVLAAHEVHPSPDKPASPPGASPAGTRAALDRKAPGE